MLNRKNKTLAIISIIILILLMFPLLLVLLLHLIIRIQFLYQLKVLLYPGMPIFFSNQILSVDLNQVCSLPLLLVFRH